MRKYFLMALLASLFLLPGCKKESKNDPTPEPVVTNVVTDMFDYCKGFVASDSAQVVTQLANDGWTKQQSTSADYDVFVKTENDITSMLGVSSASGVVDQVFVMLGDMAGTTGLTDGNTLKEVMQFMGESYTYGNMTWPFAGVRYTEGGETVTETNYSVALENIVSICDNGDAQMLWFAGDHGVMISKQYSSQNKMNFVSIMIM